MADSDKRPPEPIKTEPEKRRIDLGEKPKQAPAPKPPPPPKKG